MKIDEVKVISYTLEVPKMETYVPNTPLPEYDEVRCKKCNKLLAKITGNCHFEIKCNRCSDLYCGAINEFVL